MIEVDLMPILFEEAKAAGLGVGRDCESNVRGFITPQDQLYRTSPPPQKAVIQTNFRRFVQEMVEDAKRRELDELRERTFDAARIKLCPLFPFC
jgi:hypothetical protein